MIQANKYPENTHAEKRKVADNTSHRSTRILGYGFIVVTVVVIIIARLHVVVSRIAASKETTRSYIK